ncbi:MAG TPA: four helix bundle protein [Pyrinomonadaceae bacterium]|jgi:four helix bundle protein|nr:four helix bundle protein [Pyrinomonadaceae bacterium]
MPGQNYRDLLVWQKSMQLVTKIYRSTECFPKSEIFGLCSQIRRAVVSIPSNIAEGQGRDSAKEFVHHLSFAYGSLMEAETQLQIAANLGYIEKKEVDRLLDDAAEIGRMLNGLSRSIRNGSN